MADWQNPEVDHAVNVQQGSALAEFLRLGAGFVACCVALLALVWFGARLLLPLVPYERERALGDWLAPLLVEQPGPEPQRARLQALAERLAVHLQLDPAVRLRVHLSESAVVNAYATFGGHVIITRGLLERMPSENALALVVGHELGHVQGRHALLASGSALMLGLLWSSISGELPGGGDLVIQLGQLGFSRSQERAADVLAVAALRAEYGHAGGAADAFRALAAAHGGASAVPALLSTHPGIEARIAYFEAEAAGWDPQAQPLKPKW